MGIKCLAALFGWLGALNSRAGGSVCACGCERGEGGRFVARGTPDRQMERKRERKKNRIDTNTDTDMSNTDREKERKKRKERERKKDK